MWDIPRLYVSACSNSVQLVPLHPIIISILFHHYKELKECICEVERIDEAASKANSDGSKKKEARGVGYPFPEGISNPRVLSDMGLAILMKKTLKTT